jgi:endo-1,4-beta-xylanase
MEKMGKTHFSAKRAGSFIFALMIILCAATGCKAKNEKTDAGASKEADVDANNIPLLSGRFSFPVGAAVPEYSLNPNNSQYKLLDHFNIYVAENEMKPENIQARKNNFTYEKGDKLVNYALEHNKKARGHTLIWHSQTPAWFFKGADGETASKEELYENMKNHIQNVMAHYKGKIDSWDVCNEVVGDDGKPRDSKYYQISGGYDYVLKAFQWAREADPDARLFLNDYNTEYSGAKQDEFFKLAEWLKSQGAPIDGLGFQCHISVYFPDISEIEKAIDRSAALGLKAQITELDMSLFAWDDKSKTKTDEEVQKLLSDQAQKYGGLFSLFQKKSAEGKLDMVMLWGVADDTSWLNNFPVRGRINYPLLFDRLGAPKPAFWAVVDPSKL